MKIIIEGGESAIELNAIGKALIAIGGGTVVSNVHPAPAAEAPAAEAPAAEAPAAEAPAAEAPAAEAPAAEAPAAEAPAAGGAVRVDHKGVEFNDAYCGEATDPFYGPGKRLGQWKKKRGVSEEDYDAWYAAQVEPQPNDTAAAFTPAPQTNETAAARFANAGAFMAWVAEQQAAEELTYEDVQAAYAKHGVSVADLFPPTDAATIAAHLANLAAELGA